MFRFFFLQICPMEKQGIDGDQGCSDIFLKSKIFSPSAKVHLQLDEEGNKNAQNIDIYLCLFLRTYLFASFRR